MSTADPHRGGSWDSHVGKRASREAGGRATQVSAEVPGTGRTGCGQSLASDVGERQASTAGTFAPDVRGGTMPTGELHLAWTPARGV